jgi:hypothetical protein
VLEQADSDLEGLESVLYPLLYKVLSDYEHSAPVLCFQFVKRDANVLRVEPSPSVISATHFGQALGVLLTALIAKTMGSLGLSPEDFAA